MGKSNSTGKEISDAGLEWNRRNKIKKCQVQSMLGTHLEMKKKNKLKRVWDWVIEVMQNN